MEEDKEWGEAVRDAVAETDRKAAFIASGSHSRAFRPNRVSEAGRFAMRPLAPLPKDSSAKRGFSMGL